MDWKKKHNLLLKAFGNDFEVIWHGPQKYTARVRELHYQDDTGDYSFAVVDGSSGEKAVSALFNKLVILSEKEKKIVIRPNTSASNKFTWNGKEFKSTPDHFIPRFGD